MSASSQASAWELGAGSWSFVFWVPKPELGNQCNIVEVGV